MVTAQKRSDYLRDHERGLTSHFLQCTQDNTRFYMINALRVKEVYAGYKGSFVAGLLRDLRKLLHIVT